jgi:hypothetical protein
MSGSAIVNDIGTAVGVLCAGTKEWGPNASLADHLPGWMLGHGAIPRHAEQQVAQARAFFGDRNPV